MSALTTRWIVAMAALCSLGAHAAADNLLRCPDSAAADSGADTVTIKAVGDIVLGNNWPSGGWPTNYQSETPRRLKQVIGDADAVFGNFEGALTTHNVSAKVPRGTSVFAFRMPPAFANILSGAGFNVMAIANNHTFDFGQIGYRDTRTHLSNAGMTLVGEPGEVAYQTVRGVRLAWIGFSHIIRHNHVGDFERLKTLVQQARGQADLVIVSMQAGAEGSEALRVRDSHEMFLGENRGNTFAFSRRAIDLGADLVIGHGPHVLRGMECYRGKLIAYSLGNFVGYGTLSIKRAAALTTVLQVRLNKKRETVGFMMSALRFDEDRLPEADPNNLSLHLVNDLSGRAPLNNSVRFPLPAGGEVNYQRWLAAEGLASIIGQ